MSEENVNLARELHAAFLAEDQEKLAELAHPELEFRGTIGGLQEGQVAHGQNEIDEVFEAEDLEAWEVRRLEAEEFIDAGDEVVILLHEFRRGRGSSLELEAKTAVVVGIRDGQATYIQGYMDRTAAFEATGLSNDG